jgi:DNA-binding Lrp family transcriptional regulator
MISRIGAVIRPRTIGASTLAAIKVPPERLLEIAALVSSYPEVNHNYEREHDLNLWFVINAANKEHLKNVLQDIEAKTALQVLSLPMLADFHIDLGFDLQWT